MSKRDKDQKFIERARAEFKRAADDEREIRDEAAQDIAFRAGDQWNAELKRQREEEGRPALTFDKTHVFIQSVANEARQNKPQPKVNPIGGGATTDVANVLNGIIRHVHHRSKGDTAYDTALDYATGSSFGYVRVVTEYADPKSFDQELKILPVLDPFSVYGVLLPYCRGQKCRSAFVVETISRDEYEARYGDENTPTDFASSEWKDAGDWVDSDSVRIAEYWHVKEKKKTLRFVHGPGGAVLPIHSDDRDYKESLPFVEDEDGQPLEREVTIDVVHTCTMDGTRVLPGTETEWVTDSIPIIPATGQQLIVDGEVKLFSLIRFVRDTQRLINIYQSAIAEKIGLSNRVPYLGYKGQFKDPKWQDANTKNYAYLEVEPVMINGQPAPLPQRQQMEEQIAALTQALAVQIDQLKSGMGIFDASLGNRGNETSGAGIRSRQQQSNVTNFHFADNLNRCEWDVCLILLQAIPKIYDRPGRQVRIVGEDQQHSVVVVNQMHKDPETGKEKRYMLDVGEYDVVVTVGPSYTTARAEGADTLQQFFTAAPQAVPLLGDLWVGNLDYPWSREAARRLKAAAPQQIVNEDAGGPGGAVPPQVQQQMQQLGQMNQALTQRVHELTDVIQTKKMDIDSKERIAALNAQVALITVEAKINAGNAQAMLQGELASIQHKLQLMHDAGMQIDSQGAEADAQAADQQHQASMQSAAQQHAAGLAQGAQQHAAAQQDSAQAATADAATQAQDADAAQADDAMPKAA